MNSNIGVWVGPQFQAALKTSIPNVAFQGVDPTAYKADLSGYLSEDGGSNDGASSMAKAVIDYAAQCPSSAIVLAGWRYVCHPKVVCRSILTALQSRSYCGPQSSARTG